MDVPKRDRIKYNNIQEPRKKKPCYWRLSS